MINNLDGTDSLLKGNTSAAVSYVYLILRNPEVNFLLHKGPFLVYFLGHAPSPFFYKRFISRSHIGLTLKFKICHFRFPH
jgi:hypothetical protein